MAYYTDGFGWTYEDSGWFAVYIGWDFVYLAIDEDRSELERNAMMLYPYVKNSTISHGRVAEILGITKGELITLYDDAGLPYLDQDISDVISDIRTYDVWMGNK